MTVIYSISRTSDFAQRHNIPQQKFWLCRLWRTWHNSCKCRSVNLHISDSHRISRTLPITTLMSSISQWTSQYRHKSIQFNTMQQPISIHFWPKKSTETLPCEKHVCWQNLSADWKLTRHEWSWVIATSEWAKRKWSIGLYWRRYSNLSSLNIWAVLYCQSIVIGTDNSFHKYCQHPRLLVYLEPRERVCWLQMSSLLLGEANSVYPNPLKNHLAAVNRDGKEG